VTPHLGASTAEAQERVAVDVAEQIMAVLRGEPARYAVNAPLIPAETYSYLAPYVPVAFKAGELAVQLHEGQMGRIEIDYSGEIAQHDLTPLKAAVVGGLLAPISEDHVNVVNVDIIAQRRGLQITEKRGPSHEIYANLVKVRIGSKAGGARSRARWRTTGRTSSRSMGSGWTCRRARATCCWSRTRTAPGW